MTNEIFESLVQYEPIFDRVKARQYQPYPGRAALQNMVRAIKEHRPNFRTNLGCSSCVRSLVLEVAGLYYTEKAEREKKVSDAMEAAKLASDEVQAPSPSESSKPKRKPAKSKKNTEE